MKKVFPLLILAFIVFLSLSLLTGGCGGGGGSGGGNSGGLVNIQVEYPQDKADGSIKSPTPTPTQYPPPSYLSFYLIDILDPVTGEKLVETTRIDYPNTSATISLIPVGQVIVVVSGFDENNFLRSQGSSTANIVADGNTSVEISTTPVSPSPLPSPTITPTVTPTYTPTPTPTSTPTPTPTVTPTPTPTYTPTPTPTSTATPTPTPTPTGGHGVLYVTNTYNNKITVFNGVSRALNIPPDRTIYPSAASTTLDSPHNSVLDTSRNYLYVSDQGGGEGNEDRIVVFQNASTANGETNYHTIWATGGYNPMNGVMGLYYVQSSDILYILNNDGGSGNPFVLVYNGVSGKSGGVTPDREIVMDVNAAYSACDYIFVDTSNNIGYISDSDNNKIYRFDNFNTLNVPQTPTSPSRTYESSDFLNGNRGIYVYNDTMYVANKYDNNVLIFTNISQKAGGDITPDFILEGASTGLDEPIDIAMDPARGMLYVSNYGLSSSEGSIIAFKNFTSGGNITAEYIIFGNQTQLFGPYGITVDPTKDQ